jgi:hypothetical protein
MIRWGVRPGIVVSLELHARAQRSVGVGGEHNTLWMKRALLPVMEMAATLAAMAVMGSAVVGVAVGGILGTRGVIHNPVCMHLLPHIIVQLRCVMVHSIFVKRTPHPALQSVTTLTSECDAKPGMMWARRAVAGSLGKSNVHLCMDCTWLPLSRCVTMGLLASCMLVTGAPVVRNSLVAPESKMAHLLMVSMLRLTVQRSVAAARAYWVETGQEGNILWFSLILLVLSTPASQKLLHQP